MFHASGCSLGIEQPLSWIATLVELIRLAAIYFGSDSVPALLTSIRPLQELLVKADIEILRHRVRDRLELDSAYDLSRLERIVVRQTEKGADRLLLRSSPSVQAKGLEKMRTAAWMQTIELLNSAPHRTLVCLADLTMFAVWNATNLNDCV